MNAREEALVVSRQFDEMLKRSRIEKAQRTQDLKVDQKKKLEVAKVIYTLRAILGGGGSW